MRLRQYYGVLFLAGGVTLLAAATGPWQNKEFKDWTEKDARLILTDSPWAKRVPMPASGRPNEMVVEPGSNGAPSPSGTLGNPANTTVGPNMTNSSYPGSVPGDPSSMHAPPSTAQSPSGMSAPVGAPEHQEPVRIVWASAIPVRLAVLKLRSGDNAPDETRVAKINQPTQSYVLVVHGLPEPDADTDPKALANSAFLALKNKPPLSAQESGFWAGPQVYFFRFSKASLPITANDQQVEFRMTLGKMELKKKFELRDMRYQGQPAL